MIFALGLDTFTSVSTIEVGCFASTRSPSSLLRTLPRTRTGHSFISFFLKKKEAIQVQNRPVLTRILGKVPVWMKSTRRQYVNFLYLSISTGGNMQHLSSIYYERISRNPTVSILLVILSLSLYCEGISQNLTVFIFLFHYNMSALYGDVRS